MNLRKLMLTNITTVCSIPGVLSRVTYFSSQEKLDEIELGTKTIADLVEEQVSFLFFMTIILIFWSRVKSHYGTHLMESCVRRGGEYS